MKIQTKYLDEIEIKQADIIHFKSGLPGFIEETEFVLLDLPNNNIFQILQSVKEKDLAFFVTNPHHYYLDYEFKLDDQIIKTLDIKEDKSVVILSIVTLKRTFKDSTINLKAPIVINSATRQGKQYILNNTDYLTRASIAPKDSKKAKGD